MGQDRRGHRRRLRGVPERRLPLHGLRVGRGLRRGGVARRPRLQAAPAEVPCLAARITRCRGHRGGVPHAFALLPGGRVNARCRARGGIGGDPGRAGEAGRAKDRSGRKRPGDPPADRRPAGHAVRIDGELPHAHARPGCLAADAALPGSADSVGRQRQAVPPAKRHAVHARPAPRALERRSGWPRSTS